MVRELMAETSLGAGEHTVVIDGRDTQRRPLPRGSISIRSRAPDGCAARTPRDR